MDFTDSSIVSVNRLYLDETEAHADARQSAGPDPEKAAEMTGEDIDLKIPKLLPKWIDAASVEEKTQQIDASLKTIVITQSVACYVMGPITQYPRVRLTPRRLPS